MGNAWPGWVHDYKHEKMAKIGLPTAKWKKSHNIAPGSKEDSESTLRILKFGQSIDIIAKDVMKEINNFLNPNWIPVEEFQYLSGWTQGCKCFNYYLTL